MLSTANGSDSSRQRVLVVDEENLVVSVLQKQLQPEGFELMGVHDPSQALGLLEEQPFCVVVADQEMALMPGLEFLARVKGTHPLITRVLLTSNLDFATLHDAVKSDLIYRFIIKPWIREELVVTMRNAVAHNWFLNEQREESASFLAAAGSLSDQGRLETNGAINGHVPLSLPADPITTLPKNVDGLAICLKILYTFHPNLGNTAVRAMAVCRTLAEILCFTPDQCRSLVWAAAFHDISFVGLDRWLVRRWMRFPEKCSKQEIEIIKKHAEQSQQMLEFLPEMKRAGEVIRSHHENWDGTGYPDRLHGEASPWASRLLAVVIAYCSRHNTGPTSLLEIRTKAGRAFDPQAVEAVTKAVPWTKMPPGEREILLMELRPGMMLAGDVFNRDGLLILGKGEQLKEAIINKLLHIHRMAPMNPVVLVYCS